MILIRERRFTCCIITKGDATIFNIGHVATDVRLKIHKVTVFRFSLEEENDTRGTYSSSTYYSFLNHNTVLKIFTTMEIVITYQYFISVLHPRVLIEHDKTKFL